MNATPICARLCPTVRIALLTTSYPAHDGDPSGHFVRSEAVRLACAGNEVHVVAPASSHDCPPVDPGVRVWGVAHAGVFGWPGAASRIRQSPWRAPGAAAFAWRARACLAAIRPDRVIAHWLVPSGYPIAVHARSSALLECVAHGADVRLLCSLPAALREHVLNELTARADTLRFVAEALLERTCRQVSPSLQRRIERLAIVRPCAIEVPDVSARTRELRDSLVCERLVTAVGRLVASKRVELAVEAANLLGPATRLCVIGDGPELGRLRALDRVGNVTFAGALDRAEALAWMGASSALVHASAVEAAPTVVREARLLRVPVVACHSGDVAAWARTDAGIRMVQPSAVAIAAELEAMG